MIQHVLRALDRPRYRYPSVGGLVLLLAVGTHAATLLPSLPCQSHPTEWASGCPAALLEWSATAVATLPGIASAWSVLGALHAAELAVGVMLGLWVVDQDRSLPPGADVVWSIGGRVRSAVRQVLLYLWLGLGAAIAGGVVSERVFERQLNAFGERLATRIGAVVDGLFVVVPEWLEPVVSGFLMVVIGAVLMIHIGRLLSGPPPGVDPEEVDVQ